MKNLIKRILREEIESSSPGFDDFYSRFEKSFGNLPNADDILEELVNDIEKSPTPKISVVDRGSFCGLSLNDNVILTNSAFSRNLYEFIFLLFHEIAHQYQYKKYGNDILYKLTTQEVTNETLTYLIKIEEVADRFGEEMAKKYSSKFGIKKMPIFSPYKNGGGKESYRRLILEIQKEIKDGKISCVEEMEKFLLDHLTKPIPTYSYTGSSYYPTYGSYSYGRSSYDYGKSYKDRDDDFYDKEYEKYRSGYSYVDNENNKLTIHDEYRPKLETLKTEIAYEIQDTLYSIQEKYGNIGLKIYMEILDENGYEDFYYPLEINDNDLEEVDDFEGLYFEVEGEFDKDIKNLKEFIEEKLYEMMDEIEKSYGWEGEHMFTDLLDEEGFGDLW